MADALLLMAVMPWAKVECLVAKCCKLPPACSSARQASGHQGGEGQRGRYSLHCQYVASSGLRVRTGEQQRAVRRFAGACRFVVNLARALQQERHAQGAHKLGYAGLCQYRVAQQHADGVAGRCAGPPAAVGAQGPGAGSCHFLRPAGPFPTLQEAGPARPLRLSRPEADQARSGQHTPTPARPWCRSSRLRAGIFTARPRCLAAWRSRAMHGVRLPRPCKLQLSDGDALDTRRIYMARRSWRAGERRQ